MSCLTSDIDPVYFCINLSPLFTSLELQAPTLMMNKIGKNVTKEINTDLDAFVCDLDTSNGSVASIKNSPALFYKNDKSIIGSSEPTTSGSNVVKDLLDQMVTGCGTSFKKCAAANSKIQLDNTDLDFYDSKLYIIKFTNKSNPNVR